MSCPMCAAAAGISVGAIGGVAGAVLATLTDLKFGLWVSLGAVGLLIATDQQWWVAPMWLTWSLVGVAFVRGALILLVRGRNHWVVRLGRYLSLRALMGWRRCSPPALQLLVHRAAKRLLHAPPTGFFGGLRHRFGEVVTAVYCWWLRFLAYSPGGRWVILLGR